MAVTQHFTIELPKRAYVEGSHEASDFEAYKLTREQAEELFADLAEALGTAPAGLADDIARLETKLDQYLAVQPFVPFTGAQAVPSYDDTSQMSPEEYLASRQALEALEQGREAHSHHTRSSGSGIGVMDPNH